MGNKSDMEEDRKISVDTALSLANSLGISFLETSAKTKKNV